jgi:hypothetical protein
MKNNPCKKKEKKREYSQVKRTATANKEEDMKIRFLKPYGKEFGWGKFSSFYGIHTWWFAGVSGCSIHFWPFCVEWHTQKKDWDIKPFYTLITHNGSHQQQFFWTQDLLQIYQAKDPTEVEQILREDSRRNHAGNIYRAVRPVFFGLVCEVILSY